MALTDHPIFTHMHAQHVPDGESGDVRIARFTVSESQANLANLRERLHDPNRGRLVAGEYVGLYRNGQLWMSDTPDERLDHYEAMLAIDHHRASSILISGLGLGMFPAAAMHCPSVTKITIIEIDPIVIELVAPSLQAMAAECNVELRIVEADAREWYPDEITMPVAGMAPKTWPTARESFDVIWHDIWLGISLDNLPEMANLHRRYRIMCHPKWQGSWKEPFLKRLRERSRSGRYV